MSLLNSKINSVEAEVHEVASQVQEVASQVSDIQTTVAGGNTVVSVIGNDANDATGFKLLDTQGNLRGISGTGDLQFETFSLSSTTKPFNFLDRHGSVPMATTQQADSGSCSTM